MGHVRLIEIVLAVVVAALGSSGLWAWVISRHDKKSLDRKILIGLGHDRVTYLAQKYIDQGYISKADYENLHDYLFVPYKAAGGNGTAQRLMNEVDKLPIREQNHTLLVQQGGKSSDQTDNGLAGGSAHSSS